VHFLETFGDAFLQIPTPPLDRYPGKRRRRAKQVNVIRHDHVLPDQPRIGVATGKNERSVERVIREGRHTRHGPDRDEQDDGHVVTLNRRPMRGALALREIVGHVMSMVRSVHSSNWSQNRIWLLRVVCGMGSPMLRSMTALTDAMG
jgi:hypothetical protein